MGKELIKFSDNWNKKFEEIKNRGYDKKELLVIYNSFHKEKLEFLMTIYKDLTREDFLELNRLQSNLDMAIATACSNYRKEKRGFWSNILKGKKIENFIKL